SHAYAEEGSYTVSIQIVDTEGASATVLDNVSVSDAPLTASGATLSATAGVSANLTVASFIDADPSGTASDYTAMISWGDDSSSTGTIAANDQGSFSVTGSHTYQNTGTDTISVSIIDQGGSSATALATVQVSAVLVSPIADQSNSEGDSVSLQVMASD